MGIVQDRLKEIVDRYEELARQTAPECDLRGDGEWKLLIITGGGQGQLALAEQLEGEGVDIHPFPELLVHEHEGAIQEKIKEIVTAAAAGNCQVVVTMCKGIVEYARRCVRKGVLKPGKIRILAVEEPDQQWVNEKGVRHIPLDEKGEFLDHWPRGFFGWNYRVLLDD